MHRSQMKVRVSTSSLNCVVGSDVVRDTGRTNPGRLLERIAERLANGSARRTADIGDGDLVRSERPLAGPDARRSEADRRQRRHRGGCHAGNTAH